MTVIKQNVSLTKESFKIVRAHAKRIGVTPLSTALNSLIYQFDQMQKAAAEPDPALADLRAIREAAAPTEA
jgi:hypothetical protein